MNFLLLPIFALPLLVLLVIASVFMVRASIGRGGGPVFAGMSPGCAVCGNCGQEVSLPHIDVCPECGAPYVIAGIATRSAAVRLGPPLLTVALTLFTAGAALSLATTPLILAPLETLLIRIIVGTAYQFALMGILVLVLHRIERIRRRVLCIDIQPIEDDPNSVVHP